MNVQKVLHIRNDPTRKSFFTPFYSFLLYSTHPQYMYAKSVYNTLYCCRLFSQVCQYTLKHAPSQHLFISCETVQAAEAESY